MDIAKLLLKCMRCRHKPGCPTLQYNIETLLARGVEGLVTLLDVDNPKELSKGLPPGVIVLTDEAAFEKLEELVGPVKTRAIRQQVADHRETEEALQQVRKAQADRARCDRCGAEISSPFEDGMAICSVCREELRAPRNSAMAETFKENYGGGTPDSENEQEIPTEDLGDRTLGVDPAAEGTESESVEQVVEKPESTDGPLDGKPLAPEDEGPAEDKVREEVPGDDN